ncbi:hypothetical protein [Arthrobacter psychrolactophilus]
MDDWVTIRHRYVNEKISKRELAKQLGASHGTVDRALAAETAPKYERRPAGSSFDAFEKDVRRLLVVTPRMPATVLAERVGWTGSASLFWCKIAKMRPEYAAADPAGPARARTGQDGAV